MKNVQTVIAPAIRANALLKTLVRRAGPVFRRTIGPALEMIRMEWSIAAGAPAGPALLLVLVGLRRRVELNIRPGDIADPHRLGDICERLWSALRRRAMVA